MKARFTYKARYLLITFLLISGLQACGLQKAFSGPNKSKTNIAVVRGHGVSLRTINGNAISSMSSGAIILPGRNKIEFMIDGANYNSRGPDHSTYSLELLAEAGKEYIITGKRGDGRLCAWESVNGSPDYGKPSGCVAPLGAS